MVTCCSHVAIRKSYDCSDFPIMQAYFYSVLSEIKKIQEIYFLARSRSKIKIRNEKYENKLQWIPLGPV